jgi:hypothetical protein
MGKGQKTFEEWLPLEKPGIYHSRLLAKPYMGEPCTGRICVKESLFLESRTNAVGVNFDFR